MRDRLDDNNRSRGEKRTPEMTSSLEAKRGTDWMITNGHEALSQKKTNGDRYY
jgi:hypothetical protein